MNIHILGFLDANISKQVIDRLTCFIVSEWINK